MTDRKASTSSIPTRNDPFELDRLAEELPVQAAREVCIQETAIIDGFSDDASNKLEE